MGRCWCCTWQSPSGLLPITAITYLSWINGKEFDTTISFLKCILVKISIFRYSFVSTICLLVRWKKNISLRFDELVKTTYFLRSKTTPNSWLSHKILLGRKMTFQTAGGAMHQAQRGYRVSSMCLQATQAAATECLSPVLTRSEGCL